MLFKNTKSIYRFILILSLSLLIANSAHAVPEPICPGGSNPNSNVITCYDFENLSNCSTGEESQCLTDNKLTPGIDINPNHVFQIRNDSPAVGNGYIRAQGKHGSVGGSFSDLPLNGSYSHIYMRYYFRYSDSYMGYNDHHGPGLIGTGNNNCRYFFHFEQTPFNYNDYNVSIDCVAQSVTKPANMPDLPALKNGHWYLMEHERKIDTSCSNPNSPDGCNGISKTWIDGQLVINYNNMNYGGVTNNVKWTRFYGPRDYYHSRYPEWEPGVDFDNFVITNGYRAGGAQSTNNLGVGDPQSPYANYVGIEPFIGRSPANDCYALEQNIVGAKYSSMYRNSNASLVSSPRHAGMLDTCPGNLPDKSFKVTMTGPNQGGGVQWYRWGGAHGAHYTTFPQQVIYGWIYLPSTNNYSTKPPLSGMRGYGFYNSQESDFGNYVALTVNNGKYAIKQRHLNSGQGPTIAVSSNKSVNFNQWQEFELIVWQDQKVSLMIDREKVIDKQSLPQSVSWLFTGTSINSLVVGMIDYLGSTPFTVYYDDMKLGTASYWSCDGWGEASCPHGDGPPGDNTPPAPPTGIYVQ